MVSPDRTKRTRRPPVSPRDIDSSATALSSLVAMDCRGTKGKCSLVSRNARSRYKRRQSSVEYSVVYVKKNVIQSVYSNLVNKFLENSVIFRVFLFKIPSEIEVSLNKYNFYINLFIVNFML